MRRSAPVTPPSLDHIDRIVRAALAEDLGEPARDVTARALPADIDVQADVQMREAGCVCGLPVAERVLAICHELLSASGEIPAGTAVPQIDTSYGDGAWLNAGEVAARISGPAPVVLAAERTVLNFLQRLSAVATLTRRYVEAVGESGARVYDTRKTTPGLRHLEKYAVAAGGGANHRMGLHDAAMVKDTHIDALGSVTGAIEAVRAASPDVPIIVEVRSEQELTRTLPFAPDVILLDNMELDTLARCAAVIRRQAAATGVVIESEASGGVSLATVADIAAAGVDRISVGALTHSAGSLDIALEIESATSR